MPVNLQAIAKRAGVSSATVSRALRGTYPVALETLERIQKAMNELNYEHAGILERYRERKASPLRNTGNIGLILGDISKKFSDPYWASILDGVNEEVRQQNYHLRFTFTRDDMAQEQHRQLLTHAHIDGLILVAKPLAGPFEHEIAPEFVVTVEHGLPSSLMPLSNDHIEAERWNAVRAMMEHLISLGHRRFRFISGELVDDLRVSGFFDTLLRYHLPITPDLCVKTPWTTEEAFPLLLSLLQESGKEIDALVCASDLIAVAALRAAARVGLRVPDDIAVTGFDDIALARDLDPALTTISVPKELLGRLAVRKLIERFQNPTLPPVIQMVPTMLTVRRSCGALLRNKDGHGPSLRQE